MTISEVKEQAATAATLRGEVPMLRLNTWESRYPGIVAGVTSGGGESDFDLGLFARGRTVDVLPRWSMLIEALGVSAVVHAKQPHEATVRAHRDVGPGIHLVPDADGHFTRDRDLLLTVSIADCVPVFILHPGTGSVALIHAGWRGAAAGILEEGVARLRDSLGIAAKELQLHLGPSICGRCYEVGPEVFEQLGEEVPEGPALIDLPSNLVSRALRAGVTESSISRSMHCTRCGTAGLFSHRAGRAERQMAFLGFRAGS